MYHWKKICFLAFAIGATTSFVVANFLDFKTVSSVGRPAFIIPNGMPFVVRVSVRDGQGKPMPNVNVFVVDVSAGSGGTTGEDGHVIFDEIHNAIIEIAVDGRAILRSNSFKAIDHRNGLDVFFVKD